MATQALVRALTTNEQAGQAGFTHMAEFGPGSLNLLSETTANTSMVFNLFKTIAGDVIVKWALILDPALQDASDAAFNSVAFSFGDEDTATTYLNAVQTNVNGTEVVYTYGNTAAIYTAVKQIKVTIASMSGKALSDIDAGKIVLLFEVLRLQTLSKAVSGGG